MALNGSLVRKVEGQESQIKDVPSLKRKSSHPSLLNNCLKGTKRGGEEEEGSCWQEGCRDAGIFRTALTTQCHVLLVCTAYIDIDLTHTFTFIVDTHAQTLNTDRSNFQLLMQIVLRWVFRNCMGCNVGGELQEIDRQMHTCVDVDASALSYKNRDESQSVCTCV